MDGEEWGRGSSPGILMGCMGRKHLLAEGKCRRGWEGALGVQRGVIEQYWRAREGVVGQIIKTSLM
jgi:hypothetical protein